MYKNILVPVSFDDERNSDAALKVAKLLADKGAKITVLHVMEKIPAYAISYVPSDYLHESHKAIAVELDKIASSVPGGVPMLIEGHSGRSIVEWAGENDVDCIVVASHRPGIQDYFLGSTAAHVVRNAPCAVHVVR